MNKILARRCELACKRLPWDKAHKVAVRWMEWVAKKKTYPVVVPCEFRSFASEWSYEENALARVEKDGLIVDEQHKEKLLVEIGNVVEFVDGFPQWQEAKNWFDWVNSL